MIDGAESFSYRESCSFNPMIKIYFHTNDTRQNITFHKKDDIPSLEDSCLPQKEMN